MLFISSPRSTPHAPDDRARGWSVNVNRTCERSLSCKTYRWTVSVWGRGTVKSQLPGSPAHTAAHAPLAKTGPAKTLRRHAGDNGQIGVRHRIRLLLGWENSSSGNCGRLAGTQLVVSFEAGAGPAPNLMVDRTTFELAVTIQDRDGQRNSEGCGRHGSRACRAAGSRDCLPHSRLLAILRAPTTLAATCPCFGRDEGQRHRCRWPHCAVKTGDRREIVTMNVVVSEDGDSSGPSTGRDAFQ